MNTIERISDILLRSGKKQKELMEYLGVSPNLFTEWKAGRNKSYNKYIPQIAEFLGVTPDYLLGNEETEKAPAEDLSEGERMVLEALRVIPEEQRTAAMMECIALLMQRRQGS
jgi:transcriptional regulator with XRE-family HTH domain